MKDRVVSKKDMRRTAPEDCQRKKRGVDERQKKLSYSCKRSTSCKVGRRKGKGKDHAKIEGDKNNESIVWSP